jgi:hypothetical protein
LLGCSSIALKNLGLLSRTRAKPCRCLTHVTIQPCCSTIICNQRTPCTTQWLVYDHAAIVNNPIAAAAAAAALRFNLIFNLHFICIRKP